MEGFLNGTHEDRKTRMNVVSSARASMELTEIMKLVIHKTNSTLCEQLMN